MRVGQGYDIHRLVKGRRLMIGGVYIPHTRGEKAHSDGDVLLHAIIDALLGAAALGDIGEHFPPSDNSWKNSDSLELLDAVISLVREKGFSIENVDCTVILERPKLKNYKSMIVDKISESLNIPASCISVKGKTKEGCGSVGRGRAIEAFAVVLLNASK